MRSHSRSIGCFTSCLIGSLLLTLLVNFHARAERLPVRTYTNADGLWSSSISYLMRDSHGFIWFCTRDGLSRFDGYHFVNYRVGDAATPPYINYIMETHAGLYYVVVNGGGLYRFDPNAASTPDARAKRDEDDSRRPVLNALKVSEQSPGLIYEDKEGRLWAGMDGLSLAEDTGKGISFKRVELGLPVREFIVGAICEGQDGSLWLGTNEGLIRRLPDGRVVHFAVHPQLGQPQHDEVRILMEDREGRIWIGHVDGLYVLWPEPLAHLAAAGLYTSRTLNARAPAPGEPLMPDAPNEAVDFTVVGLQGTPARRSVALAFGLVAGLIQLADGKVWIATPDGLTVFDGQRFHSFTAEQGLTQSNMGPFAEDAGGDLWLASLTGAIRLRVHGLTTYDRADGMGDPQVNSIYEDRSGALHVVSGNWLINRLDAKGKFTSVRANIPLRARFWWTSNVAFLDRGGEWWMLTTDKLYRFSHAKRIEDLARQPPTAVYEGGNGMHNEAFYCMFEDSRGDLWISVRGDGGLTRWERSTQTFHDMTGVAGFPTHTSPASFAEDRAGNLWFGLYEGGLLRYAGGRFETFKSDDGLPAGLISSLHLDHAGRLWITSSIGGVSRIDDPAATRPSFASYTEKEGLSSNNARCLTEDLHGQIYIGTVRGVDRLNPETGSITHFTVTDGLAADFVRTAFRDRHGTLWFGTFNGLSRLDPWAEEKPSVPGALITGLRIGGVKQPLSELGVARLAGLELAATQNNLQIDFSGLGVARPESLRYQYKLEGADQNWSGPTEQRRVNYANLAPGDYLFVVRTVSVEGVANDQRASVGFVILPPLWQRWWFLSTVAVLLAAALYALYRYRVSQLLQVERVRTRIASDLHDDIGASLSRMAILSEVVKRQAGAIGEQPTMLLNEIAESARGLVDSMGDIVWSINPRHDDLSSVVQRVRQFASDVLEAKGIVWEFRVTPAVERVRVGPEKRRHLFLIFKEGVNNVARHAGGCRSVALSISVGEHQLFGEISDDGCGFVLPKSPQPTRVSGRGGNGLLSMRVRAEQLGGRLDIESASGLGTRVKLRVPLK